jgi:uncharacterized repeat protein (TIGR01451 family)
VKKLVKFINVLALVVIMLFVLISKVSATQVTSRYFELYNYPAGNNVNTILSRRSGVYFTATVGGGTGYKPVIKVVEASGANNGARKDANAAIYCARAGVGFGSDTNSSYVIREYNQSFDMRNPSSIPSPYRDKLPTDTATYNKLMWVLEHLAVLEDSNSLNSTLRAAGLTIDQFTNFGQTKITGNTTETAYDMIETAQQAAIWYYSHQDTTWQPVAGGNFYYATTTNSDKYSMATFYQGTESTDPMRQLYTYLVNGAETAVTRNGYTYSQTASSGVTFDKSRAKVTKSGSNYLIGPYKFTGNKDGFTVTVSGSSSIVNSAESSYAGSSVTDKIKNSFGSDFYISVPVTEAAQTVGISYNSSYNTTSLNYLSTSASNVAQNQPLVEIKKETKSSSGSDQKTTPSATGSYNLRIIKTDNGTAPKALAGATFKVTLANGTSNSYVTDQNGAISIPSIAMTKAGTDTITIEETAAPTGYAKLINGAFQVLVTKTLTNGSYVASNATLQNANNNVSITNASNTITVTVKNRPKIFDLALRKYITAINGTAPSVSREPVITQENLRNLANDSDSGTFDRGTTAYKRHPKNKLTVKKGDTVRYTIRIYNEGEVDGKATIVSDYLPAGLKLKEGSSINEQYGWKADSTGKAISTNYLANTTLKAFNRTATNGQYIMSKEGGQIVDLEIECEVIAENNSTSLKNVAEITSETNDEGLKDVDSTAGNISNDQKNNYNVNTSTMGKGYEDDDDFEDLKLSEEKIEQGSYKIKLIKTGDEEEAKKLQGAKFNVTLPGQKAQEYTTDANGEINLPAINVTAEGTDTIKFEETKAPTGYDKLVDSFSVNVTKKSTKATDNDVTATFLFASKAALEGNNENVSMSQSWNNENDYSSEKVITITVKDKKQIFDLALRKFITKVNDEEITNRIPQVDKSNFGKEVDGKLVTTCTYNHTKEPVRVAQKDIVTYTIRIYNEGTQKGYASVIKDDIPEGLVFLPDNETNKTFRWKMLDESGKETTDVEKAKFITTDYLSKEQEKNAGDNLLDAFDPDTMDSPAYKDVQVAFRVTEPNTSDRIIINKAQISEDKDEDGNDVDDRDSTPDEWNEGEDDQDIEKIYVKYFDLSLRKWVTQAIVIEDGQEKVMNTGHYAEQDPEPVVKVEINKKRLNDTVIKFKYSIRIKNEGEIEGYATEISDYIPNGLKFNQADNPKWKEANGKITTDQLKDTLLKPGETATVDVTLTWINSEDNMGVMTNVAEISQDKNDSDTPDIDSTPNNKKSGEDDIDDAPVAITVVSGKRQTYIALITGILVAMGAALAVIKRFVI